MSRLLNCWYCLPFSKKQALLPIPPHPLPVATNPPSPNSIPPHCFVFFATRRAEKTKFRNTKASQRKLLFKRKERDYNRRKSQAEEKGEELTEEAPEIEPTPEAELEPLPELPSPPAEENNGEFEALDVWVVSDVLNAVEGVPLFVQWDMEDWALLQLRYELHLMIHFFVQDTEGDTDPSERERRGIPLDHMSFYYDCYYKSRLNEKYYGYPTMRDLIETLTDTILVDEKTSVCESDHDLDTPLSIFVKLVEEARRTRNSLLEAGDETARLKFNTTATTSALRPGLPQKNDSKRSSAPPPPSKRDARRSGGSAQPRSSPQPSAAATASGWGARLPASRDTGPKRQYGGNSYGQDKRPRHGGGAASQYY